jgi:hypothetical protein
MASTESAVAVNLPLDVTTKRKWEHKWNAICINYPNFQSTVQNHFDKVKRYVRRGIPDECRGIAWQYLTGSVELKQPERYASLLRHNLTEATARQIELDLPRTHFKKSSGEKLPPPPRDPMRRVLHAYAIYDPAVGYVQGMAFVVAVLIHYMSEEDSFWMLVRLMDHYNYHNALIQDFPFVKLCLTQLRRVIRKFTPKLYHRLSPTEGDHKTSMLVPMEFFTAVFVALLSDSLPWELLVRVWDSFFFEEWKTIFRFVVALLQFHEERLLKIQDDSAFITAMRIPTLCLDRVVDATMQATFKVRLQSKTLFRVCTQYNFDRFEEWLSAFDVVELASIMQGTNGVEINNQTHMLKAYPSCFVGRQAVDWMIVYMQSGGLTKHCTVCRNQTNTSCSSNSHTKTASHSQQQSPVCAIASAAVPQHCYSPETAMSFSAVVSPTSLSSKQLPPPTSPTVDNNTSSLPFPTEFSPTLSMQTTNSTVGDMDNNGLSRQSQDEEDDSDSDDDVHTLPPRRLCWCVAELGMDTAYCSIHLARHSKLLEQQRRVKAVLILSTMERKKLFRNVVASDDSFTDDSHSFYRFESVPMPPHQPHVTPSPVLPSSLTPPPRHRLHSSDSNVPTTSSPSAISIPLDRIHSLKRELLSVLQECNLEPELQNQLQKSIDIINGNEQQVIFRM